MSPRTHFAAPETLSFHTFSDALDPRRPDEVQAKDHGAAQEPSHQHGHLQGDKQQDGDFAGDKDPKTAANPQTGPAIVMVEDGATGQFNRANRSLTHFTEFAPAIVVLMLVARDAFPAAVFILSVVYAYGRVIHQTGEAGVSRALVLS